MNKYEESVEQLKTAKGCLSGDSVRARTHINNAICAIGEASIDHKGLMRFIKKCLGGDMSGHTRMRPGREIPGGCKADQAKIVYVLGGTHWKYFVPVDRVPDDLKFWGKGGVKATAFDHNDSLLDFN